MDLETFFVELYVMVDDWYKAEGQHLLRRHAGGVLRMSDSEVLTIAIAGQWRMGVPWTSERSLVRYLQTQGRQWFPQMLERSALNSRIRQLWAGCVRLHHYIATQLNQAETAYEVVDCLPLPACSHAQARVKRHWWWWSRWGHGGNHADWFFGDQLLLTVTQHGAISGWLVGSAQVDDRWMLQALVSSRAGQMDLSAPAKRPQNGQARQLHPPAQCPVPSVAAGRGNPVPYLADQGFNGARWHAQWRTFGATVITVSPANAPDAAFWTTARRRALASLRQSIETVFASLTSVFRIQHLQAHSRWGQLTRIAAICAAFNFALWLNLRAHRPPFAIPSLLL